jgi:uncharacterized membrane protein
MVKNDQRRIETNLKMTSKKGSLLFGILGSCFSFMTFLLAVFTDREGMVYWKALPASIVSSILIGVFIFVVLRIFGIYIRRKRR